MTALLRNVLNNFIFREKRIMTGNICMKQCCNVAENIVGQGVKLIFTKGHVGTRVTLKGLHVMVRQYNYNQMQCKINVTIL